MEEQNHLSHWSLKLDEAGIGWLTLDRADMRVNTLNESVLLELQEILHKISKSPAPKALVILSGKKTGFIAGADIEQFKHFKTAQEAADKIRLGQEVFALLESLPLATIAVINGFCLGGGLELALSCRYRIACDSPKTRLGLPEVMLGIQPGWGGTVRLPRLIGSLKALEMILSGRPVNAKAAWKMGLVDVAVPDRHLNTAILHYATQQPALKKRVFYQNWLEHQLVRPWLGKFLKHKVSQRAVPEHYPAPFAIIDNWVEEGPSAKAYALELQSISRLMVGETAHNLVRVFYLQENLKGLGKEQKTRIQRVHVVGAGVMGGDIAAFCALKGFVVTLQDANCAAIAASLKRALELFKKILKEPHLVQAAVDRLIADSTGLGVAKADLIIEAIIENKAAKQALFKELEAKASQQAIFATNTSTIPLQDIAAELQNKSRLLGIHFFNPVAKLPLVEVVHIDTTDQNYLQEALAFVKALDKLPLPVQSKPGFLVNRLLMPYLLESMLLLQEGLAAESIDEAALKFGMPMGPIELADTVGLDVCLAAAQSLSSGTESLPERILALVKAGHLGKKTQQGLYRYKDGKPVKIKPEKTDFSSDIMDITDRLLYRLFNEAFAALEDEVVTASDDIDAGMIFGAGFPPFRGGPLHYVMKTGKATMYARLKELEAKFGPRFKPHAFWLK